MLARGQLHPRRVRRLLALQSGGAPLLPRVYLPAFAPLCVSSHSHGTILLQNSGSDRLQQTSVNPSRTLWPPSADSAGASRLEPLLAAHCSSKMAGPKRGRRMVVKVAGAASPPVTTSRTGEYPPPGWERCQPRDKLCCLSAAIPIKLNSQFLRVQSGTQYIAMSSAVLEVKKQQILHL